MNSLIVLPFLVGWALQKNLVWMILAVVYLLATSQIQLSINASHRQLHNMLWYHELWPISCHFWDCKMFLVTLISNAIGRTQTFTFTFSTISKCWTFYKSSYHSHKVHIQLYIKLLQKQEQAFTLATSIVSDHTDMKPHHKVSWHTVTILCQHSGQCRVDKTTEHTQLGHIEPLLQLPEDEYLVTDPDHAELVDSH